MTSWASIHCILKILKLNFLQKSHNSTRYNSEVRHHHGFILCINEIPYLQVLIHRSPFNFSNCRKLNRLRLLILIINIFHKIPILDHCINISRGHVSLRIVGREDLGMFRPCRIAKNRGLTAVVQDGQSLILLHPKETSADVDPGEAAREDEQNENSKNYGPRRTLGITVDHQQHSWNIIFQMRYFFLLI